eukprot:TRINITY_DN1970_c0_g1_i1.p1 TRINITY_DN1970_c0_g1~~TRINITY_DN1970_c0_g1_i1.p1  ORF type:complete len:296 (+),score=42.77 TRINITY_DN1970_c0_g1_i1:44-889(+)
MATEASVPDTQNNNSKDTKDASNGEKTEQDRGRARSRSVSKSPKKGRNSRSRSSSSGSRGRGRSYSRSSSRSRSRSPRSRSRTPSPPPVKTLFVGQLTRNVTREHLVEIFSTFGTVKHVDLHWDKRVNLSRGTAHVEFGERDQAEKASTYMDGAQVDGNVIRVNFIQPPRNRYVARRNNNRYDYGRRGGGRGRFRARSPMRRAPYRRSPDRNRRRSPYRRSRSPSPRRRSRSPARSYSRSPSPRRKRYSSSRSRSPVKNRRRSYSRSPSSSRSPRRSPVRK